MNGIAAHGYSNPQIFIFTGDWKMALETLGVTFLTFCLLLAILFAIRGFFK